MRTRTRAVRPSRARDRRWAWLAALLTALLVASGCARLPQDGPVQTSEPLPGSDGQVNYTFTPAGPGQGDSPEEIIRGFLLAGTGVQDDHATAREFLTDEAAQAWEPEARTLVYTSEPTLVPSAEDNVYTVQMEIEAVVDERGMLDRMPASTTEAAEFEVVDQDGQWRISRAPAGIVLETTQFRALYGSHELYFYDQSYRYAVPDVRWFLNRPGIAAEMVDELLDGPAAYLEGAVRTAFQSGSALARPSVPVSEGTANVDVTQQTLEGSDSMARRLMLQQLELTLGGLNDVSTVEMSVDLEPLDLGPPPSGFVAARVNAGVGSTQVAVAEGQLAYYEGDAAVPVGGLRLPEDQPPADPGMSLDATRFAFLDGERARLSLASTDGATNVALEGERLTRPSFDYADWVWTVDHSQGTRVLAFDHGSRSAAPIEVSAEWLGDRTVTALRISRDGTRAAIVAGEGDTSHLYLSGVIRDSEGVPRGLLEPVQLEPTVPVTYVTWLSDQEVVVAAPSETEPVEAQRVGLDGSLLTYKPLLGMTGFSTGPGDNPVYAETAEAVHALAGSTWRSQTGNAQDLAFPG